MKTWFRLHGGKAHLLVSVEDLDRFPLGRAACAPIDRRSTDTLHQTNDLKSADFCGRCVDSLKGKKK